MRSKPSCTRKLDTSSCVVPTPPPKKKNIYIYIYNNNNNDDTNNNKSLNPMAKDELLVQRVDFELSSLGSSDATDNEIWSPDFGVVPRVSIVVPFFGFTDPAIRILYGNPKKELQWRL